MTAYALDIERGAVVELCGYAECQYHSCDGCMDTAVEYQPPHCDAYGEIYHFGGRFPEASCKQAERGTAECSEQVREADVICVLDSDDDYTAQVIGNGQCCEENLEPQGYALGKHAEYTKAEGDICGHRNGQAPAHQIQHTGVTDGYMQCDKEHYYRHKHSSACSYDGKHGFFDAGQFASAEDFSLQLKTNAQEEYGHQEVVDKLQQVHCLAMVGEEADATDAETNLFQPYGLIPVLG